MAYFVASFSFILAVLVPSIVCDYQVEVTLIMYNNSQGRLQDGSCCDLDDGRGGCFPQDTCDVRFSFSVQNFNTLMTFHSQTKVLDTYSDTDVISFPNCSVLINDVRNPLTFVIPMSQWSSGEALRVQAAISDVDQNPTTGALELQQILGTIPIATITRPAAPSAVFSSTQTFSGANSLTLMFQYRVICTPGTCGPDCSQTSNCEPFPSCTPITCDDQPCLNGGTCINTPDGYTCVQCNSQSNCATCDDPDPCSSMNPCLNGGTCNTMGANFTCTCQQGFTGKTCRDDDSTESIDTGVQSTTSSQVNQKGAGAMLVVSLAVLSFSVLMIATCLELLD